MLRSSQSCRSFSKNKNNRDSLNRSTSGKRSQPRQQKEFLNPDGESQAVQLLTRSSHVQSSSNTRRESGNNSKAQSFDHCIMQRSRSSRSMLETSPFGEKDNYYYCDTVEDRRTYTRNEEESLNSSNHLLRMRQHKQHKQNSQRQLQKAQSLRKLPKEERQQSKRQLLNKASSRRTAQSSQDQSVHSTTSNHSSGSEEASITRQASSGKSKRCDGSKHSASTLSTAATVSVSCNSISSSRRHYQKDVHEDNDFNSSVFQASAPADEDKPGRSMSRRREGMRRGSSKRHNVSRDGSGRIPSTSQNCHSDDGKLDDSMDVSASINQSRSSLSRRQEAFGRSKNSGSRRQLMHHDHFPPNVKSTLDDASRKSLSKRRQGLSRGSSRRNMSPRQLLREEPKAKKMQKEEHFFETDFNVGNFGDVDLPAPTTITTYNVKRTKSLSTTAEKPLLQTQAHPPSSQSLGAIKKKAALTSAKIRRNLSDSYEKELKEQQKLHCGELNTKPKTVNDFANWETFQQNGDATKIQLSSSHSPTNSGGRKSNKIATVGENMSSSSRRAGMVRGISKRGLQAATGGLGLIRQKSYKGLMN